MNKIKTKFLTFSLIFLVFLMNIMPFISNVDFFKGTSTNEKELNDIDLSNILSISSSGNSILTTLRTQTINNKENIYYGHYQTLDTVNSIFSVGPYGTNNGVFGSDYHPSVPNTDWSFYQNGEFGFEQDFLNIINQPLYGGCGTYSVVGDPFLPYKGIDVGIKNLLKRIGGMQEIYRDGMHINDVYAIPTEPDYILYNSYNYPEYHRPIKIKIEETWEAYTMGYYGSLISGVLNQNDYPMFTLYVPHVNIEFEFDPTFISHLNQKARNAGLASKAYSENIKEIMGVKDDVLEYALAIDDPKDFIKDKAKEWLATALIAGILACSTPGMDLKQLENHVDIASEIYSMASNLINLLAGGKDAAGVLIGFLITADLMRAQQAGEELKAVLYASYLSTFNYFKASIYAAIQIAQMILQSYQAHVVINKNIPAGVPQWFSEFDIYQARRKDTGQKILSHNSERWGSNAISSTFNTPISQLDDYNGDGYIDWNDLGIYGYHYAQYQTAYEEAVLGEPEALYYAHHCLGTFLIALVLYFNLNAKYCYDSRNDIIPDSTYSLDIFEIQATSGPPDNFRKKVFGAFTAFGLVHNDFINRNQENTLFPLLIIPDMILDLDGDGLTNSEELILGSDPYNPDSDGDGIDDGWEYYYWGDPMYTQATADSDGDFFSDIIEIYYFHTNPLVPDDDLDGDGLSLADELLYGTDPTNPDSDGDYLLDGLEVNVFHTNPTTPDTDADNIMDGIEVYVFNTNPLKKDSDNDGLTDYEEIYGILLTINIFNGQEYISLTLECYSDPNNPDTDGDGLIDGYEVKSLGTLHVYWDTDLDGLSDGWENSIGFDPLNSIDPAFQFSYNLPTNPTAINPGTFTWSISEYYPRKIVSVLVEYRPPGGGWSQISSLASGSFQLNPIAGFHEFRVTATNDNGLTAIYSGIGITVLLDIPPGPPTVYGSEDLIFFYGDSSPHVVSFLLLDNSVNDPAMYWILDHQLNLFGLITWQSGNEYSFDLNYIYGGNPIPSGVHTITILVWEDYSGAPNDYIYENIYIWVLDDDVEQLPDKIGNHYYGGGITAPYFEFYPLHGIPRSFGNTGITCEQIHIDNPMGIMAGIWNKNPISGSDPFPEDALYFAIDATLPANFFSGYNTLFTITLLQNYDPDVDTFILLKWDDLTDKWLSTNYAYVIDWIGGTYTFRIEEWGIFALGKYVLPSISKPKDLVYVYDNVNIVTYELMWTLTDSMITIPQCDFYFNFLHLGTLYGWEEGNTISVQVDSSTLPPGLYTVTAIFYDPIVDSLIRHDVNIWVLPGNLLPLSEMESSKLYDPGIYSDIPLGDLEIMNVTTLGATIAAGTWDHNPLIGNSDPFNDMGVYFKIETDVPDWAIAFNDPKYPFVISVPLPANYDPTIDILTLMVWNEDKGVWEFTDFKIEVNIIQNRAQITLGYTGLFALGVIEPRDTTPPIITIEYSDGDGTDEKPGKWNVQAFDNESGNNFASINVFIDGKLVSNSLGEYEVNKSIGMHTIYVEIETNNPLNPIQVTNTSSIEIIDDDINSPELSDLIVEYDFENIYISINAFDIGSGISEFNIFINGTEIVSFTLNKDINSYYFILENFWINYNGTYAVELYVTDADNDRVNDSLTSSISGSFIIYEHHKLINIESPENKSYTEIPRGHYPGTYSFENDDMGFIITNWIIEAGEIPPKVIPNIEGHSNVLNMTGALMGDNFNTNETTGTIEWWTMISSIRDFHAIGLTNDAGASDNFIAIYFNNDGIIYCVNGSEILNLQLDYELNQWYHIKIEFNTTAGTYHLWIDGLCTDQGNGFTITGDSNKLPMNYFLFGGNSYAYMDAIGYSWDPGYNVGDNLHEGLVLNFETSIRFDSIYYSLDGQKNISIVRSRTIPVPEFGNHTVQIFGIDSKGMVYDSNICEFFINLTLDANFASQRTKYVIGQSTSFYYEGIGGFGELNYYWEFGDGGTSTEMNPVHQYDLVGTYDITLTVTDELGNSDSITKIDYINIVEDLQPKADFYATPTTVLRLHDTTFIFNGSEGNDPAKYKWEFGDGKISYEKNPTHSYSATGYYTITLTITDLNGDIDIIIKENYIEVTPYDPAPVPGFTDYVLMGTLILAGISVISIIHRKIKLQNS